MNYKEKIKSFAGWLQEKQAKDISALDVKGVNSVTEGLLIITAVNTRHAQALADQLLEKCKESGIEFLGMEGYQAGTWILIDCNDVVVHIFHSDFRGFYNLDGLWSEAPRLWEESEEK